MPGPFLICDFQHHWGGWFHSFVSEFASAGWLVLDVEETFDWRELPGPAMLAVHNAASCEHVLAVPRGKHKLGAYVHSVGHFPFTVGFRPADPREVGLFDRFDRLFVATEAYRRFVQDLTRTLVIKVGFPFHGPRIWPVGPFDRVPSSGCIAQRLDADNNPLIAASILYNSHLSRKTYFDNSSPPPAVKSAMEAAGISRVCAPSHRHFLQMLGRNEWMVSATFNESFGVVFAEAACLGVKVCAPRVQGLCEMFEPESLYDPFSIDDAVRRIAEDSPAFPLVDLRTRDARRVIADINMEIT